MPSKMSLELELRGECVTVEFNVAPAEPDVGLMSEGICDELIRNMQGEILPWELTGDEWDKLYAAFHEADRCRDYDL